MPFVRGDFDDYEAELEESDDEENEFDDELDDDDWESDADEDSTDRDEDQDDEDVEIDSSDDQPSGPFEYEAAEATYDLKRLSGTALAVWQQLTSIGATAFLVNYDGGHDEGFSHPDAVVFGDIVNDITVVAADLAARPEVLAALRSADLSDSLYGNATEIYGKASPTEIVGYALDELAEAFASTLLGEGYGTGEYELYGSFRADLTTGAIQDDPNSTHSPPSW